MVSDNHPTSKAERVTTDVYFLQTFIANVCFVGNPNQSQPSWALIDAGIPGSAGLIRQTAAELYGKDNSPQTIILTHGHFDHIGAVEELVKEWHVPIFAHEAELPYLTGQKQYPPADPSVSDGLMTKISPLYPRDPINLGGQVKPLPSNGTVPFMPDWRWIATSGHTPGRISLFRDSDRILIAGDAFTTVKQESAIAVMTQAKEIHAPPVYFTINWEEAGHSIETLQSLKPERAIAGHGQPMSGEELHRQLEGLSRNFVKDSIPEHGRYVEHPVPVGAEGTHKTLLPYNL